MRDERMRFLPQIPATLYQLALDLSNPQFANVSTTIDGVDNIFAGACGDFGAGTFSVVFMSQRQASFLKQASVVCILNFCHMTDSRANKKPPDFLTSIYILRFMLMGPLRRDLKSHTQYKCL